MTLTNPLQLLSVAVTQLVFQNSQQVGNDVQAFCQKTDTLVHFEIASYGLVDRLQLWLDPE